MSKKDQYANEILSDYTKCVVLDKAGVAVQNLIQAAQDEVWELIEKVLNHNLTECIDTIEFVDPPQVQKGITLNCKEGGLNYRIAKWTFREAILEAAKELEIE